MKNGNGRPMVRLDATALHGGRVIQAAPNLTHVRIPVATWLNARSSAVFQIIPSPPASGPTKANGPAMQGVGQATAQS